MQDLIFPPLMTGMPIEGRNSDPFDRANAQASLGVDAGLIACSHEADRAPAPLISSRAGSATTLFPLTQLLKD